MYERHGFREVLKFRIPAQTFLDDFGVETDEVVHVLKYELLLQQGGEGGGARAHSESGGEVLQPSAGGKGSLAHFQ